MTKHEREFIPSSPPIDDTRSTIGGGIDPAWDVAQIATRGHVLTARISALSKLLFVPVLALGVVSGYGVLRAASTPAFVAPPRWLVEALTYDEATYFDLGGGLRGPKSLAWMGDYAPTPESLSLADYDALVAALRDDLSNHSALDPSAWSAVAGLKIAPKITSPARLFSDFADRLKDGAIVIDKDNQRVAVVAYVGGQWALTMFGGRNCASILGPSAKGCEDYTREEMPNPAREFLAFLNPKLHADLKALNNALNQSADTEE